MPDLEAQGPEPQHTWRRPLPDQPVTLGMSKAQWAVPWDKQISRPHATLHWQGDALLVRRRMEPPTTNRIYYEGKPVDEFRVGVGGKFVIGKTTFTVLEAESATIAIDPPTPLAEMTCSSEELRQVRYVDPNERIEVLMDLPAVIRTSSGEGELEGRVCEVLLRGIPRAEAAAVVQLGAVEMDGEPGVEVRRVEGRRGRPGRFQFSKRLVRDALCRRRQGVLHLWQTGQAGREFTVRPGTDWALCVPLPDEPSPGWGLYVDGRLEQERTAADATLLKGDLKFAQLAAEVFGALRQVLELQRREAHLSKFLSRSVRHELAGRDINQALRRRVADVTVLMCDLRGSCHIHEQGQQDLLALSDRISAVLDLMAGSVIDQEGTVADFLGDAVIGFWGWPRSDANQASRAARAALNIQRRFAQAMQESNHPLRGFTCGIGIAHGPAVAGRLGSLDQFKIDVFGPVVNRASRLESLTKVLRVPILLDEASAQRLAAEPDGGRFRHRRLARIQPYGMEAALLVSQLLPPEGEPGAFSAHKQRDYETALNAFVAGHWPEARELLQHLRSDGPARFLEAFMDRHPQGPPADFNGVLVMEAK